MTAEMTLTDARIVSEPEKDLKFSSAGNAMLNIRTVTNRRYKDKDGEWKDASSTWLTIQVYGLLAELCAEQLYNGDIISASGTFEQRDYENAEGEKRSVYELNARKVSKDLRRPKAAAEPPF